MSDLWSDAELSASVDAYVSMLRADHQDKALSKRAVYRALASQYGRTEKAFEYRMQNISAVLEEMGLAWVPGLKPASNVGADVSRRIAKLLESHKVFDWNEPPTFVAPYVEKLPAVRDWLVEVARNEGRATYGDVMRAFGIDRFSLRHAMSKLGHQSQRNKEPIITALIVNANSKRCSSGFQKEFGVSDDEAERRRLYAYWRSTDNPVREPHPKASLESRAARFASVEVRPAQAAFRRAVFLAYEGKCAISGCDIGRALDAAHLQGRIWREGHNRVEDGVLLRKDLHALYDAGLLTFGEDRTVALAPGKALEHYRHFDGMPSRKPKA